VAPATSHPVGELGSFTTLGAARSCQPRQSRSLASDSSRCSSCLGRCGLLIFEVAWFHRFALAFGSTVWATNLVVASFMGGLALGTACVTKAGHRIVRPFAAYAVLEAVLVVSGVALTLALPALASLFTAATRHMVMAEPVLNLIRFSMAFAAMAVPTTAMGATLPLLVTGMTRRGQDFGRVLGRLYGWNTMGALAGVLGAETILISQLGIAGSAWVAGLLDLSAAGLAWLLSGRLDAIPPVGAAAVPRPAWRRLGCAFLAGANLLALELLWFRFLAHVVVNSTLALSLMLATVLGAIALGA